MNSSSRLATTFCNTLYIFGDDNRFRAQRCHFPQSYLQMTLEMGQIIFAGYSIGIYPTPPCKVVPVVIIVARITLWPKKKSVHLVAGAGC